MKLSQRVGLFDSVTRGKSAAFFSGTSFAFVGGTIFFGWFLLIGFSTGGAITGLGRATLGGKFWVGTFSGVSGVFVIGTKSSHL